MFNMKDYMDNLLRIAESGNAQDVKNYAIGYIQVAIINGDLIIKEDQKTEKED